jgi:hypothetical protein
LPSRSIFTRLRSDLTGCQTGSVSGDAISIQTASSINLSQRGFSHYLASNVVQRFSLRGQRRSKRQIDSVSLFDNGDLRLDCGSSLARSQIDFGSVNVAHNVASRGAIFLAAWLEIQRGVDC